MKTVKLMLLFMIMIGIVGCSDSREPNEIAYVTAIGIDEAENNNCKFTVQFAKPTKISGSGEEDGKGGDIIENISVESPDIYSAVGLVNDIISKNLSLSHMKLFVFSEEIAKNGIRKYLETIARSDEIRQNVYVAVSNIPTKEYLDSIKPIVEINPSKYYQMIYDKSDFGGVPKSYCRKIYFDVLLNEKNAVLPIASVVEKDGKKAETLNKSNYEYNIYDYNSGELGEFKENQSEALGAAVFKSDKMIGKLGMIETDLYNILVNDYTMNYMSIKTEKSNMPITVAVSKTDDTKIKYNKNNNLVNIKISLDGEFVSMPDDYIAETDIEGFENEVNSAIHNSLLNLLNRTKDEFNSDIVGIGKYVKCNFLTYKESDDFDFPSKYKDVDFNVEVDFNLRRTGLTNRGGTR